MNDDAALLRLYVDEGSEAAFRQLVARRLNLVYGAALRRTGGNPDWAADVAQEVFVALARHARRLTRHPALGAWLHTTTRNAALDLMKAERRRRRNETTAALDPAGEAGPVPDWDRLRPLLDEAIDELSESDRSVVVLRFLEQRGYLAVGAALRVSEDAARMRAERALDKLRIILGRRGITSTSAALGVALTQQTLTAAPPGLAASIGTAACSTPPVGFATLVVMSKLTTSVFVAAATAGLTFVSWKLALPASAADLAALREENARLVAAAAPDASPAETGAITAEFTHQANAIAGLMQRRLQQSRARTAARGNAPAAAPGGGGTAGASSSGHRNHGNATAKDAQLTFAWAADAGEVEALARLLLFDRDSRKDALAVLAGMPASIRAQYRTPEELYAFFLAAETQLGPPPGADLLERMEPVEAGPGRVKFQRPGGPKPGYFDWAFQQTGDGWKVVIIPELIPIIPRSVMRKDFFTELAAGKP